MKRGFPALLQTSTHSLHTSATQWWNSAPETLRPFFDSTGCCDQDIVQRQRSKWLMIQIGSSHLNMTMSLWTINWKTKQKVCTKDMRVLNVLKIWICFQGWQDSANKKNKHLYQFDDTLSRILHSRSFQKTLRRDEPASMSRFDSDR